MTRGVRTPLLVVCALVVVPPSLRAQLVAAMEAGASRIVYDGSDATTAWSLTPSLHWQHHTVTLLGFLTYARFPSGGWSLQGAASGSWLQPLSGSLTSDIGVFASGTTSESAGQSAQWLGRGRLLWGSARSGAWFGGSAGRGGFEGARMGSASIEAAGWTRIGRSTLTASVSPEFIGDSSRYTDAELDATMPVWKLGIQAQVGVRTWSRPGDAPTKGWGNVTAVLPIGRRVAAVASGGSYPEDVVQEIPSASFIALSLRVTTGSVPRPDPGPLVRSQQLKPLAIPVAPAIQVRRARDTVVVQVRAPRASSVELMGEFTAWEARALQQVGGDRWELRTVITPGPHRFNLRVDGGPWGVPDGVTVFEDEFGGVAGLLLVP